MTPIAQKRGWLENILVTLICLSGGTAAAYFLYLDYYDVGTEGSGKRMATVEAHVSSVRRKPSSSYRWTRARTGQNIFRKDSILVGPGSSASLRLEGNSMLEIGENSLIVLDDLKNLSLNFMRGAFILRSDAGDKKLTIDPQGKIRAEDIKVRLLMPAAQTNVFTAPSSSTKVSFRWKSLKKEAAPKPVTLQISSDPKFAAATTQSFAISDPNADAFSVPLYPGNYYWRLHSEAAAITEVRGLNVLPAKPIRMVWPTAGSAVDQWGNEGLVQFRWVANTLPTDQADGGKHHIEVARDAGFTQIVMTEPVIPQSGMVSLPNLPEGALYWRLVSIYGDRAIAAKAQKLTVNRVDKIPVTTMQPEDAVTTTLPEKMYFQWNFDRPDAEFVFELEKVIGERTEPLLKAKARSRSFVWKQPAGGVYRWRVSAMSKRGQTMGDTEWKTFSFFEGKPIVLKSPLQGQKLYFWEKPLPVDFSWDLGEAPPLGTSYLWELSQDLSFKKIIDTRSSDTAQLTGGANKMGPGTYFWRVKLVDTGGRNLQVSEARSLIYDVFPLLPAPVSARPRAGIVISVLQSAQDPSLEWDAVPQATAYEISLRAAQGKASLSEVIQETSFALKGFSAGKYNWSVKAVDKIGRRGAELPWREFTLHYGPLPAPKSVVSEVQ